MSNRRTFIATAASALAWLVGVRPEKAKRRYVREYRVTTDDDSGGWVVPVEFAPAIVSGLPLIGAAYVTRSLLPATMEEVCKARGIAYEPEPDKQRRPFLAKAMQRALAKMKASTPCES